MFLEEFKHVIEAKAVNSFWDNRKTGQLRPRAEKHGQMLLGVFGRTKLSARGALLQEAKSGVGFVDVFITFSSGLLHVVELKMLKGKALPGPSQLAAYMAQNGRKEGWLVFFDCRKANSKLAVQSSIKKAAGTIRTVVIDINPIPPHKLP